MIKQTQTNQQGFTILELMIATMVFSVILLLVTSGMIQIGRAYYRGVLQSRTQETARNIIDEISRGIQFSGVRAVPTTPYSFDPPYASAVPGNRYGFCINKTAYSYFIDQELIQPGGAPPATGERRQGLISYPFAGGCQAYTAPSVLPPGVATLVSGSKELIGFGMRLTELQVVDSGNNTFTITVEVGSGARDLFNPSNPADFSTLISTSCRTDAGNEFCVMSRLETTVQKRVK